MTETVESPIMGGAGFCSLKSNWREERPVLGRDVNECRQVLAAVVPVKQTLCKSPVQMFFADYRIGA